MKCFTEVWKNLSAEPCWTPLSHSGMENDPPKAAKMEVHIYLELCYIALELME